MAIGGIDEADLPPLDVDVEEEDNYSAQKYPFAQRLKYYAGGAIDDSMFAAVQNACIIEAGRHNTAQLKQKVAVQEETIFNKYVETCQCLYSEAMISVSFHAKLMERIYRTQKNFEVVGANLLTRFARLKREVTNNLMPHLPLNYKDFDSGKGLNDAFKKCLVKVYKKQNPVSGIAVLVSLVTTREPRHLLCSCPPSQDKLDNDQLKDVVYDTIPSKYQFDNNYPMNCFLAAKVHVNFVGFTNSPADMMGANKPKSRQAIKDARNAAQRKRAVDKMNEATDQSNTKQRRKDLRTKIDVLQKQSMNKILMAATSESAWEKTGTALERALDAIKKHAGENSAYKASTNQLLQKLVDHTLKGPPPAPQTPEKLRRTMQEVIDLCDDNRKPSAVTVPPAAQSGTPILRESSNPDSAEELEVEVTNEEGLEVPHANEEVTDEEDGLEVPHANEDEANPIEMEEETTNTEAHSVIQSTNRRSNRNRD